MLPLHPLVRSFVVDYIALALSWRHWVTNSFPALFLSFSLSPSLFLHSRAVPSFSFQLHRRRLFFRPFIGGSPYSWAFASLPDNPRVKLLCPVGIALARTTFSPFCSREGTLVVRHFSPPSFRFTKMKQKTSLYSFIKLLTINDQRYPRSKDSLETRFEH